MCFARPIWSILRRFPRCQRYAIDASISLMARWLAGMDHALARTCGPCGSCSYRSAPVLATLLQVQLLDKPGGERLLPSRIQVFIVAIIDSLLCVYLSQHGQRI